MPPRLLSFEMPVIVGHLRNENIDVSMAGDFRRHIGACVHEFAIAKRELVHMNHVLDVKMKRLPLEAGGAPSLEAEKYLKVSAAKHLDLGDAHVLSQ